MQFAGYPHLHHDVGAADELALHIELRDRRPVGIVLDALTDFHVLQHVDAVIFDAEAVEHRDRARGKAALGKRSEEHTSELQLLMRISYAVFCLTKKKTQ